LFLSMNEGCAIHRLIYNSAGAPVDYLIMNINPAYEQIVGKSKDAVIGKKATEVYGVSVPPYLDVYSTVAATEKPYVFETYFAPMDKYFRISVFSPERGYFATIFSDITNQKFAENILRGSEQRFRSMFETHQSIMLLIDPNTGAIIDANPSAARFYGYPRETLQLMKITDINQLPPRTTRNEMKAAVNTTNTSFVFPHKLANGDIRTVEVYSSPINVNKSQLLFSIIFDITNRKLIEKKLQESEKLYRSLFENMLNGFAFCRMIQEPDRPTDFMYLAVNDAFERTTGLTNVIGKRVSELIPGIQQTNPGLLERYARVSDGGLPERFEDYIETLDMWFDISVYSPQHGYFVAVFDVITERKKMEEAMREEIQLRAHFIDILAHELKGPLTPMISSSELLQDLVETGSDENLKRIAANIHTSANILATRLEELLELARYSRGTFRLNCVSTDIPKFIKEIAARYTPTVDGSGHELVVSVQDSLPVIELDPSRMEQVLINLLSNACKYSPPNTVIRMMVKQENNSLVIEVADQGEGLSEEDQKHLFQPYYRLKQNRNKSPGLGLGLSICNLLVKAHSGTIGVSSQKGVGSTFRVILPLTR